MFTDLRFAFRNLTRSPLFALTAVAALGLGIGVNSAIFSVLNALMLHPSGISQPDRVMAIRVKYDKLNLKSISISVPDFTDVRDDKDVFSSAAILDEGDFSYTGGDVPERLQGARVSWQWFDVLGAHPALGRVFRADEDQPNVNRLVILSDGLWKRLFGGDRSIVGRTVQINQQPYQVIGVMRADFHWPAQADIWVPLGLAPADYSPQNRFNESYFAIARIRPGISPAQAVAGVKLLGQRLIQSGGRAGEYAKDSAWGMFAEPLTEFVSGDLKKPLLILAGAVAFVLLIACSNIAGLLLARATERAKEFAVRAALGAGRWDLIRPMLSESVLLAFGGACTGLALAWAGIRLLLLLAPQDLMAGMVIPLDSYVLAFTLAIGILAGILFGIAPAWRASRLDQHETLKEGGRSGTAGKGRQRLRGLLVVGEVSLALVLLVGAGLFLRSLSRMQSVDTGFQPRGVITARLSLPENQKPELRTQFYRNLIARLTGLPGVQSAGIGVALPFSGQGGSASFNIEGRPSGPGDPGPHGDVRWATPGYFASLRIPLLKGRYFGDQDREGSEPVVMIDENLAGQYWRNEDPIGKRLRRGTRAPWATIVGVAGHVKHSALVGDSGKGVYYYPMLQQPLPFAAIVIRASGDPARLAGAIRDAVRAIDPGQPVYDIRTMEDRVAASLAPRRFAVVLLTVFACMALLLAAIGLYGVISYGVTQRTHEIGIRMALGAQTREVLALIVRDGMRLAGAGVLIGLMAALALARLLSSQLFEVSSFDPLTFAGMAMVLGIVALLASYVPARRAARVDPMVALRYE